MRFLSWHVAVVPRCDIGANDATTTRRFTVTVAASWSGSASASQVRARCARRASAKGPWLRQRRERWRAVGSPAFSSDPDSNDLVDRGPNQRELQPLGHSDIAIDNLAQVERNAEIECYVGRCRLRRAESPARFLGCGKRPAASLVRRTLKTEQAKHRVADQRDDLAAMF